MRYSAAPVSVTRKLPGVDPATVACPKETKDGRNPMRKTQKRGTARRSAQHRAERRAVTRFCVFLIGFLPSFVSFGQATVAGSTPGSFRVTETGAAEYRIPIQVPPGVASTEPRLALVYNSQAGNGLLGVGWNLEGLSAITRCPRTMAQDGVRGGINYDANDRYCLDGQRLVGVSGTYGTDGAEYRTERESFSKVISYGN